MKSIGIVRKVDQLGRVVIPQELRNMMDLTEKSAFEIFLNGDQIILSKYSPGCVFCGEIENVVDYKNKNICPSCLTKMQEMAN